MREIAISRPKRVECCAVTLNVSVNGEKLAKLKNGQRIVMQVEDGPQEIRVHGGFFSGKDFQDTVRLPAGQQGYSLQVDFVSSVKSNYLPVLRPGGGEHVRDDARAVTLMGAALCKFLLSDEVRDGLRKFPGTSLKLLLLPQEWRVLLWRDGRGEILLRCEYERLEGGLSAAVINAVSNAELSSAEGRERILDRIMTDYVAWLPGYERDGKYGIVMKG